MTRKQHKKKPDFFIHEILEVEMDGDKIKRLGFGAAISCLKCSDARGRPYFSLYRGGVLYGHVKGSIKKHMLALALKPCAITTGIGKYAGVKFQSLLKWQQRDLISGAKQGASL